MKKIKIYCFYLLLFTIILPEQLIAQNNQAELTIGGTGSDDGMALVQSKDGGYAIVGYTNSFGAGGYDVYVVKLDSHYNLQWTKTIGGTSDDEGWSIVQTKDGGYAITGYTTSFGAGGYDVYIVKLDSSGNLQWTKTVGTSRFDWGYSIIQSKDGGYAVTGWTASQVEIIKSML